MTTATDTTSKTTEYTVTLGYAPEEWEDGVTPDGDINYDTQPTACRTVVVTMPSDSTPFDIYCEADALIDDDDVRQELEREGASGLDGDGICISFDGNEYQLSYDSVPHTATWKQFHCHPLR